MFLNGFCLSTMLAFPTGPGAATSMATVSCLRPKPPWPSPGFHHRFFLRTVLPRKLDSGACLWDCVWEKGWYIAAGKGLTPVSKLLYGLIPCIMPPVASTKCLFTVWDVFPVTASRSKQMCSSSTRRSPDSILSGFLHLLRSISSENQGYPQLCDAELEPRVVILRACLC